MKKIYTYLFLVGFVFSGCDSITDLQPQPNIEEAIPKAAVDSIKINYPEASKVRFTIVEKGKIFQSDFEIKLTRMSAIINNVGFISEMYKQTDATGLLETIKTYIDSNYPRVTYLDIRQQINRNKQIEGYKVRIKDIDTNESTLVFDATGTLMLAISDNRADKPKGAKPQKIYFINKNELPPAVINFLATTHGNDFRYIKAAVVLTETSKNYSIVISEDFVVYDYLFDENGNVLHTASFGTIIVADIIQNRPLLINDLTNKIEEYLDEEFDDWKFERGLVFSQNGIIEAYNILIIYEKKYYSVQFDGKGDFVEKEQILDKFEGKNEVKNIQPKDLPDAIASYLADNHSGFKYINTSIITQKNKKNYWVTILMDTITFDYIFDTAGNVIDVTETAIKFSTDKVKDKAIEAKDIPNKAKEYLNINYKNWVFERGIATYVANKIVGYRIAIKIKNDYYYINFDANADFLSARKA